MYRTAERRNILYAITSLDMGGEEHHLFALARYMRECGHDVKVCCLHSRGEISRRLEEEKFPLICFDEPEYPSASALVLSSRRMAALIREHRIDLVHSFLVRANVEARLAGRLSGTRCAVVNSEACINLQKSQAKIWLDRWTFRWCDVVLANSRAVAKVLSRRERVPQSKIRIVYQGIDVTRFRRGTRTVSAGSPRPRKVVIGYIGRLHPEKGPRYLVEAARLMAQAGVTFEVVFVGDGPEGAALRTLAYESGLSDRVRFAGMQADVTGFLRSFDILAIPSLEEGLPTVAMEALACGVPMVATGVGGTPEVNQHGFTGLLVPSADPVCLAQALTALVTNEPLRRRLGQNGPRIAEEKFHVSRMLTQTATVYEEVLQVVLERATPAA